MTIDWILVLLMLVNTAVGFCVGSRWAYLRVGLRVQKAIDEGSVFPWDSKAYVISPVPHTPKFPDFVRQMAAARTAQEKLDAMRGLTEIPEPEPAWNTEDYPKLHRRWGRLAGRARRRDRKTRASRSSVP